MTVASDTNFAERLRALRERAGLRPVDLAEKSGLTKQAISSLEKGDREPTWDTLLKLARGLGVSLSAFDPEQGLSEPSAVKANLPPSPTVRRGGKKK